MTTNLRLAFTSFSKALRSPFLILTANRASSSKDKVLFLLISFRYRDSELSSERKRFASAETMDILRISKKKIRSLFFSNIESAHEYSNKEHYNNVFLSRCFKQKKNF